MAFHRRRLGTFLNDHLAIATAGVELSRRTLGSNRGTPYEPLLERAADELTDDRELLLAAMAALQVRVDPVKHRLAWVGEKLGRLKPNDSLLHYSPLSRMTELEGLLVISGLNHTLFATLDELAGSDVAGLPEARERATQRIRDLEAARPAVAREALTGSR